MSKKALQRGLQGIPMGIAMGFLIPLFISLQLGDGGYHPSDPALVDQMGNELSAVILQTVLCALLGGVFAASSVIWEMQSWSLIKQTGIYFSITALVMLPIAYFAHWMEHSLAGFLGYFGIFLLIFVLMWGIQYLIWKHLVNKINQKMTHS